ncbi:hypothetical protein C4579_03585 [Candidatus Microgenomates bacterium]|nr:MAG: hypothetical protein C4579_03585 [Candidatus Microgenomates bacterium]
MRTWHRWRFKNLTLFAVGIVVAIILYFYQPFHEILLHLNGFSYVSAFIVGMMFVSTITVGTAMLMLLILAEQYPPLVLGLIAGFGAVISDMLIFRFVRDDMASEIKYLYKKFGRRHFKHVLHSAYFRWTLPVIGALIIASPLPDEIGVSLLGLSRMRSWQFFFVSFFLNFIGIFLVVSASRFIKP